MRRMTCSAVALAALSITTPAVAKGPGIQLTPIPNELGNSYCSIELNTWDKDTIVGGRHSGENEPWYVGVNGKLFVLRQLSHSATVTEVGGVKGAPHLVITSHGLAFTSANPANQVLTDNVTVNITWEGKTTVTPAFQACGVR